MKSSKIRRIKLLVLVIFLLAGVEYFVNQTNEDNNKPRSYDLRNLGSKFENLGGLDSYLKSKADIGEQERLLKTLQFALEERDSEDEELVAYVRTLIREPFLDNEKNLTEKHKTDFSQIGQSKYIDELLEVIFCLMIYFEYKFFQYWKTSKWVRVYNVLVYTVIPCETMTTH